MQNLRLLLVAGAVSAAALTACAADESSPGAESLPTASASQPTSATPTSSPSSSDPSAWRDDYSPEELEAFDDALARWNSFERLAEPIWAEGKLTLAAERLFRRFSRTAGVFINRLRQYEAADIQVIGRPTVLSSVPTRLELRGDGSATVRIRQCVDYTTQTFVQYGEEVEGTATTPQVRILWLSSNPGAGSVARWYVDRLIDSEGKSPCQG